MPDRGNFDAWVNDTDQGGARLNLAKLDLIQSRNNILKASLEAVSPKSWRLLSVLAILSEAVDYTTLAVLKDFRPNDLAAAMKDLQRRGLLQYEANRYDLHPAVRAMAARLLSREETQRDGRRLVDAISARPHNPWDDAKTMEDVQDGVHVVRTWLRMGRYQEAYHTLEGGLANALIYNLEAYPEVLSLLRPFFPNGWATLPKDVEKRAGLHLLSVASIALSGIGAYSEALEARSTTLTSELRREAWLDASVHLSNLAISLREQNRLSQENRAGLLVLRLAALIDDDERLFRARFDRFRHLATLGLWEEAQTVWNLLDHLGRNWSRAAYRPGDAEFWYAVARFRQGNLNESHLAGAQENAEKSNNPFIVREIHKLRGRWFFEQQEWVLAARSLSFAVQMARAARRYDPEAETRLKLAQFHLGMLANPRHEAEQLENAGRVDDLALAELWLAIADHEKARAWALSAYRWAWSDGEPFVWRYDLTKSRALLETLGAEIPDLPKSKYEKFPCEDEVEAAIKKLEKTKAR